MEEGRDLRMECEQPVAKALGDRHNGRNLDFTRFLRVSLQAVQQRGQARPTSDRYNSNRFHPS